MSDPITVDIPHKLGRAQARQRIDQGVSQIAAILPGGKLVAHFWEGDTLNFSVEAVGQRLAAKIDVHETHVHAVLDLPPIVALFAEKIKAKLLGVGTKLLR